MPTTNESPNVDQFTSPYFFFTYDQSGYLRFASQSVERVLGYSAAKIIGRHHGDFLVDGHELNQSVAECHERRFSQTGEHNSVRALVAQDGGIRIVSVQTVGITDANDRIVRCQGLAIDTTEDYLRNQALCAKQKRLNDRCGQLKPREKEVLDLIMAGKLNKQIAAELSIAVRTVESTRSRLMRKLDVDHFNEVVSLESQRRLLSSIID